MAVAGPQNVSPQVFSSTSGVFPVARSFVFRSGFCPNLIRTSRSIRGIFNPSQSGRSGTFFPRAFAANPSMPWNSDARSGHLHAWNAASRQVNRYSFPRRVTRIGAGHMFDRNQ